jgi:hypothetical protein
MNVLTSSRRLSLALLLFLAATGCIRQALASGDSGCSPEWRMVHHGYEGCSNMAFLSPSNDTRVNLLLMMADLRPARPGAALKTRTNLRPEAPLFFWEQIAGRLGSPADRAELRSEAGGQIPSAPPAVPDDSFVTAVQADHALRPEERDALVAARRSGQAAAASASAIAAAEKVAQTPSAWAYALYLEGAAAFWHADYVKAAAIFVSLTNAASAWVREIATYMVGRTLVDRAQVGAFDQYGSFNTNWHADAKTVADAEQALDRYLQQYPKGAYAKSARGLKRRGYWLAQDTVRLEQEYGALLLMSPEERNVSDVDLAQEIDTKVTEPPGMDGTSGDSPAEDKSMKGLTNPELLAMFDLQAMRTADDPGAGADENHSAPISRLKIEAQKPYFAAQMPLYEYLLAVHSFYVDHKAAEVLHMIPDDARQASFSYLEFSRQVLRGLALEATKGHNSLGFWTQMLPGATAAYQRPALELAIAYHEERAGELGEVFAADSPVQYPYLREVLLANVADADLLRAQAKNSSVPQRERNIALFTLLFKEATRGKAAEFLKDVALVPPNAPIEGYFRLDNIEDSYFEPDESQKPAAIPLGIFLHDQAEAEPHFSCPGLRAEEEQSAEDATNPTAQLCIADFVRLNDSVTYLITSPPPGNELGGTPSMFPGGLFVRMDTYRAVLANAKSSKGEKAYALFRAVKCYAPSGDNDCGGKDVPKAQRKAWFTTLKRDYAGTRWANALQYYW